MNPRRGLAAVLVALALVFAWLLWPRSEPKVSAIRLDRAPARTTPDRTTVPAATAPESPPEPRSALADELNSPQSNIQADLRVVLAVVDSYRSNFHENPTGTNAEITAALTGRNRLLLALIPRDHPAVNLKGELCDRWGRPFFFHQLSGTRMEIRSGGPDRKLWTDDDVVLTPGQRSE